MVCVHCVLREKEEEEEEEEEDMEDKEKEGKEDIDNNNKMVKARVWCEYKGGK